MTFADIPAGAAVFLDSNILLYSFTTYPLVGAPSQALLERIERGDIEGFSSTHVLSEVKHRLMVLEAIDRFGWPAQGMPRRLKRHPNEVRQLTWYRQSIDKVRAAGIRVFDVTEHLITRATDVTRRHGILSNDALIVAVMEQHQLTNLASNDGDFDRVPGLTRYAPV